MKIHKILMNFGEIFGEIWWIFVKFVWIRSGLDQWIFGFSFQERRDQALISLQRCKIEKNFFFSRSEKFEWKLVKIAFFAKISVLEALVLRWIEDFFEIFFGNAEERLTSSSTWSKNRETRWYSRERAHQSRPKSAVQSLVKKFFGWHRRKTSRDALPDKSGPLGRSSGRICSSSSSSSSSTLFFSGLVYSLV